MIAGVAVLYNPSENVPENINSYINQVAQLFIVDNSDKYSEVLKNISPGVEKPEYVFNNDNLGIAAALNIGIDRALKAGYTYLLTMDQDSYFEEGSLNKLISNLNSASSVGIYSPFHKNKFFTSPPQKEGIEEVSDVMTSGNILNLDAVNKVGKFREDYFIDYVDIEYCLRLRKNGYSIIRVNEAILVHNEANLSRRKFFGITVYPPNHSAVRWYYKIRNYLYLKKEYQEFFKEYFEVERKNVRNNILKVLLFEKEKIKKINMMLKGYIHFHKNIVGKLSS